MTPARASLLLSTAIAPLALVACDTVKKPIRGYDKQPPGTILLDDVAGGTVMMWPMFDLPHTEQIFRPRLDGHDVVYSVTYQQGFEVPSLPLAPEQLVAPPERTGPDVRVLGLLAVA